MYLLDTNIISELRKGARADQNVLAFVRSLESLPTFLSVQTIGELRRGIERLKRRGDTPQASQLEAWLNLIVVEYRGRILDFDADCAQVWGKLSAASDQHPIDKQIAAIALLNNLTVVTRNVADFADTGATLLNPFVVSNGNVQIMC